MGRVTYRALFVALLALCACPVGAAAQPAEAVTPVAPETPVSIETLMAIDPPASNEPFKVKWRDVVFGSDADLAQEPQKPYDWVSERRACEGCPPRSVGRALWQTTAINVIYELANLIRGQVTARITPKTWWDNMSHGWVWDLDDFEVNQVGHPYQGNNYFTSGRANGLSFYESAALTAFGSATWEYFGETNLPSVNDFINTTLGGIALGEMFHRASWLVRDTRATGRGRRWREIGALALDPLTGLNRFRTGDANRMTDKPPDMVPSSIEGFTSAGVLWRGSETRAVNATGQPFLELDMLYGNLQAGESKTPYDAFTVRLRFGGGATFSEARVRGRLLGEPFGGGGKMQFTMMQSYDYQANDAYRIGSQSIEGAVGTTMSLSTNTAVWFAGWGGLTVLGAIDSLPLGVTERPPPEEPGTGGGAGQGVSEGPRFYDYGPGSTYGTFALFTHNRRAIAALLYEGRHIYSLDGVRANHFVQRARIDAMVPLRGRLGLGASGEYFFRQSFYQDEERTQVEYRFPQFRAYFTWSIE